MTALLVALGAAVGAPLRYLVGRWVQERTGSAVPFGTLAVNVGGSFLLGLLAGLPVGAPVAALLGAGFCGGLTTYSTFGWETVALAAGGARRHAVLNVVANVVAGLAAAALGMLIGTALS